MEISITRALAQIKLIEKKVYRKIGTTKYMDYTQGSNEEPVRGAGDISAQIQSINDLISRRSKLKSLIIASNGTTMLTIGHETMTVAAAIEKKSSIELQKELLLAMQSDVGQITHKVEEINNKARYQADNIFKDKASEDNLEEFIANYLAISGAQIINDDNFSIQETIENLSEYIETFENEVDLCLSESNSVTTIEIED